MLIAADRPIRSGSSLSSAAMDRWSRTDTVAEQYVQQYTRCHGGTGIFLLTSWAVVTDTVSSPRNFYGHAHAVTGTAAAKQPVASISHQPSLRTLTRCTVVAALRYRRYCSCIYCCSSWRWQRRRTGRYCSEVTVIPGGNWRSITRLH